MLELRDVSRSLGRDTLLNRVSLQFTPNTPTAVLGLSAPAREAFLRLLSGVDKPHLGSINLGGKGIAQARREKGKIIRIGSGGVKPSSQRVRKLIGADAAERVGLSGRMDAALSDLDPAQRVRLAIAMAREDQPALILLDSPGLELGSEPRMELLPQLQPMLAQLPSVVVLAGLPDEALGLAGQVVVLSAGQVAQSAPAQQVFLHPVNLAVAQATSQPSLNLLPMQARQGAGMLADGAVFQPPEQLALPPSGPCTLAFRPQDASLQRAGPSCLRFVVRVSGTQQAAAQRYLQASFAGSAWLLQQPASPPPPGSLLNVFVDRSRLLVFDATGQAVG